MATDTEMVTLILEVQAAPETDASDLDQTTRDLLAELRDLELDSAAMMTGGAVPGGAKTASTISAGTLVLACLPAVIPALFEYLQNWKKRKPEHVIKIKTQIGERSVEVEFPTEAVSLEQLKTYVETLTKALEN